MTFWALERLLTKTQGIISAAKETNHFSPAQESKLYGLLSLFGKRHVRESWLRWPSCNQGPQVWANSHVVKSRLDQF